MTNQIKVICSRCNGSGHYSFNLARGTVCFGCEGTGFKMVDAAEYAKKLAKNIAIGKKRAAQDALRQQIAAELYAEKNAQYGPFPNNERGAYDLWVACMQNEGKSIGDMVNAKLNELSKVAA